MWPVLAQEGRGSADRAEALRVRLEHADGRLHRRLRAAVQAGQGPALFRRWLEASPATPAGEGYDALDELVAGLLRLAEPGTGGPALEPGMVFYQPTPARHVLDMLARVRLAPRDVLVDLGSGLGHVPMLASLCTGARALGVEWQESHVTVARAAARALRLARVTFVAGDARDADLSAGTVFFLYTPFVGAVLRQVLDALHAEGRRRPIRVCTFGPCSPLVAREAWLRADGPATADRVVVFQAVRQRSD
ncbi:MAG TPA: hypothetical protein VFH59_09620 [Frateuria sp.]|uniref:hypothetical protein n=1 Tax=Frateuria sp. TaxID=2211372 RepID=UPI002D7E278B|nr:hypothetical protein [Frateuria sp.]HET6805684.1 hypothetical protein [Frateuria sp.]